MNENLSWVSALVSIILGGLAGWGASAIKIGRYAQMVDDLKKDVGKLEDKMEQMSIKVTQCETKIDERTKSYASTLTEAKSPIGLSEAGENLLKRSGSDAFVLNNQRELVEKIKDKNPKSAYDVQEFAKEVVESLADDLRFIPFKNFVFKEGIGLDPIFIVMSIYLRDIALSLLGYKPEDVDHSTPKTQVNEQTKSQ